MGNRIFGMLNYSTEYAAYEEDRQIHRMQSEVCFAAVFPDELCSRKYVVRIYKGTEQARRFNRNNNCIFTKSEIEKHIMECKKLFPFSFTVIEDEGIDRFIVTLCISGPAIYHRFLLTWVRYLYEFPYNMFLYDAIRLYRSGIFRATNIFNIYNIVSSSGIYSGEGHSIDAANHILKLKTIKELQHALEDRVRTGEFRMYGLFDVVDCPEYRCQEIERIYSKFEVQDLDFWVSKEHFEGRKHIYEANYRALAKFLKNN